VRALLRSCWLRLLLRQIIAPAVAVWRTAGEAGRGTARNGGR